MSYRVLSSLLTNSTTFITNIFKIRNNQGSIQKAIAQKGHKKEDINIILDLTSAELRTSKKPPATSESCRAGIVPFRAAPHSNGTCLTVELKLFKFIHLQNK